MAYSQLVYVSRAHCLMASQQLSALLEQARKRNATLSLTGMLLYKDQSFIQVIEGPSDAVSMVFSSIQQDQRHTRISVISHEDVEQRSFKEWHMGFVNLDTDDHSLDGFVDFFSNPSSINHLATQSSAALDLLKHFRAYS